MVDRKLLAGASAFRPQNTLGRHSATYSRTSPVNRGPDPWTVLTTAQSERKHTYFASDDDELCAGTGRSSKRAKHSHSSPIRSNRSRTVIDLSGDEAAPPPDVRRAGSRADPKVHEWLQSQHSDSDPVRLSPDDTNQSVIIPVKVFKSRDHTSGPTEHAPFRQSDLDPASPPQSSTHKPARRLKMAFDQDRPRQELREYMERPQPTKSSSARSAHGTVTREPSNSVRPLAQEVTSHHFAAVAKEKTRLRDRMRDSNAAPLPRHSENSQRRRSIDELTGPSTITLPSQRLQKPQVVLPTRRRHVEKDHVSDSEPEVARKTTRRKPSSSMTRPRSPMVDPLEAATAADHDELQESTSLEHQVASDGALARAIAAQDSGTVVDTSSRRSVPETEVKEWFLPLTWPFDGPKQVSVDYQDLFRLDSEEFLNDNLINFCLRHLEVEHAETAQSVYFFNTYFYDTLMKTPAGRMGFNYDAVKRWTKRVDLFSYDHLIIPVNRNFHWYLFIVSNLKSLIASKSNVEPAEEVSDARDPEPEPEQEQESTTASAMQDPAALVTDLSMDQLSIAPRRSQRTLDRATSVSSLSYGIFKNSLFDDCQRTQRLQTRQSRGGIMHTINPSEPMIIALDSMGVEHASEIRNIKKYIVAEAKARRSTDIAVKDINSTTASGIPTQANASDCGIFLIGYVTEFLHDPKEFVRRICSREMDETNSFRNFDPDQQRRNIKRTLILLEREAKKRRIEAKKAKQATGAKSAKRQALAEPAEHGDKHRDGGDGGPELVSEKAASSFAKEARPAAELAKEPLATKSPPAFSDEGEALQGSQDGESQLDVIAARPLELPAADSLLGGIEEAAQHGEALAS